MLNMKNGYWLILILFIILIILCKMSLIEKFVDYVVSNYDNNTYKVQKYPNQPQAANTLAKINEKVNKLITHLEQKHSDDERVKRLISRLDMNNLEEAEHERGSTSYTINKGELISLCIRDKNTQKQIHKVNHLMFVIIHELAHIMSVSEGHTNEFMDNFKFLLRESNDCGSYFPVNYEDEPFQYCGMKVTHNPFFS